jgi:hypothetical protein
LPAGVQVAVLVAGLIILSVANGNLKGLALVVVSWALLPWAVLVPLILKLRREGRTRTVSGILITGGIGFLLSSACASILLHT